jgi:AcrR family transcriptional regulator
VSQVAYEGSAGKDQTRAALVAVAERLLREGGTTAVTTRAVAAAAGVQAPTIYRLFGDKDGLLDAVAEHALASYVASKTLGPAEADPLSDLRTGWNTHLGFGLANPTLFALLVEPNRAHSPAAVAGLEILTARVHRLAATGRLRVAERHAVELIHAAGTGAVLTLIATPADQRDLGLADTMYDAVLRTILSDAPELTESDTVSAAVALRVAAPDLPMLTVAERALLVEWLDRVTG